MNAQNPEQVLFDKVFHDAVLYPNQHRTLCGRDLTMYCVRVDYDEYERAPKRPRIQVLYCIAVRWLVICDSL